MDVDFGRTSADYAKHRKGFPDSFFDRLQALAAVAPGQRVLDAGTGTGTIALGLAARGFEVTGLDPAAPQLAEARRLAGERGLAVDFVTARAEATGLPAASFDGVCAGQCWAWFPQPETAAELRRLLVPRGWLVVAHLDWIPLDDNIVAATERLIEAHNPDWPYGGGTGIHPEPLADLKRAGFESLALQTWDEDLAYTHEDWRGRIRASAGISASLSPARVEAFDAEHAELLAERHPSEPLAIPHRISLLSCQAP